MYEQSNFYHVLGLVSQTRVSGGNQTHTPHTKGHSPSQIKSYIITGLVSNLFNAPCKMVTPSLQKRKHHNT